MINYYRRPFKKESNKKNKHKFIALRYTIRISCVPFSWTAAAAAAAAVDTCTSPQARTHTANVHMVDI